MKLKKVFNNDVVANKSDEIFLLIIGKVIKYFDNSNKVKLRVERTNYLNGNCPKYLSYMIICILYDYIKGENYFQTYQMRH